MKNLSKIVSDTLVSSYYKMTDKTPIVRNMEPTATSATIGQTSSVVHSQNGTSDQQAVNNCPTFVYEELMHGSVPCPSCEGSGRIPKEREKQLVALIPLTDERLKPRRTLLYVIGAVMISVIMCSLCMFFLIPRSISLTSSGFELAPFYAFINESEGIIKLSFVNEVNITNDNYVTITIINATMTSVHVLDSKRMVGQVTNLTQWTVPLRYHGVVAFNTSITFESSLMVQYCNLIKIIYMEFDFMVTSRYLGHDEQSILTVNQRLLCSPPATLLA